MKVSNWAVLALLSASASPAMAATAQRSSFGQMADGRAVEAVTLSNGHGMSAKIIAYGAILQSLSVPDRTGKIDDVVLGFSDIAGYLAKPPYFGATVGRYANRIAKAQFVLDGKTYTLAKNNGPNTLHGGTEGFDKKLWTIAEVKSGPAASSGSRTSCSGSALTPAPTWRKAIRAR